MNLFSKILLLLLVGACLVIMAQFYCFRYIHDNFFHYKPDFKESPISQHKDIAPIPLDRLGELTPEQIKEAEEVLKGNYN